MDAQLLAPTPGLNTTNESKAQPWRAYVPRLELKPLEDNLKKGDIGSGVIRLLEEVDDKGGFRSPELDLKIQK